MGPGLLHAVLFLAYGPLALIVVLYLTALVLRWCGRPRLLKELVDRTKVPTPLQRKGDGPH